MTSPPAELDPWCRRWLGAGVVETLSTAGHLSRVYGVRLVDGREVAVKVRPAAARLAGCADVQRALWQAGFPCPQPLVDPVPFGDRAASAESWIAGGELLGIDAVEPYARLLADLIRLAPGPSTVRSVRPNPPWTAWDHDRTGVWPCPDDRDVDLNARPGSDWLDEVGRRTRNRLRAGTGQVGDPVVGHGDWEAQNLRWRGGAPWVVHDWDSVIVAPEAVVVGLAAAVWPCGVEPRAATVEETGAFLEAYQHAVGRRWSGAEQQVSWAAGLWVSAFNTKKAAIDGGTWLAATEADERLHRAAA